ncbi:MAG: hypothetical protein HQM09_16625 [Candidatus Riflebacteria bacterium]|nr:hypothetical protein [Candidatus Riflebacteria bacterium]
MDTQKEAAATTARTEKLALVSLLALLSFTGYDLHFPIVYCEDIVFGSIFSIVAIFLAGVVPGIIVTLVGSLRTYPLWNHPYGIVISIAETIWIDRSIKRGYSNPPLTDMFFWLLLGIPMVALFYGGIMGLEAQEVVLIALKQSVNGVFNALVAGIILTYLPYKGVLNHNNAGPALTYSNLLFQVVSFCIIVPVLGMVLFSSWREFDATQKLMEGSILRNARNSASLVRFWLSPHLDAVSEIARLGRQHEIRPSELLQDKLEQINILFPDFHNVFLADSSATTVAFFPRVNERGESTIGINFSDREYFKKLKNSMKPVISDVFMGRGGVFVPIFSICVPIIENGELTGFGLGAVNVTSIQKLLQSSEKPFESRLTVLDSHENTVISTDPERHSLEPFKEKQEGDITQIHKDLWLLESLPQGNTAYIKAWNNSFYFTKIRIEGTNWSLRFEMPVTSIRQFFQHNAITDMASALVLLIIGLVISRVISHRLSETTTLLTCLTNDLPSRLGSQSEIIWPESNIVEINALIANFRGMAEVLKQHLHNIEADKLSLELKVAERTAELQQLNSSLEQRVDEEVVKRRESERLLAQKTKYAAMGEMLGAIAHQWRQPLNTLGLCIQNVQDTYHHGELDGDFIDRSTCKAMDQIQHMSRTIDDFRNFFLPSKELETFDSMVAVGNVLTLMSSKLTANNIDFSLKCHSHQKTFYSIPDITSCGEKTVEGYKNKFEHVIINLVNNAMDAIIERRKQKDIGTSERGMIAFDFFKENDKVVITISDNGGGIPPEILDRIFEPYFTTKDLSHGTGIGLYLAKSIVEGHLRGNLTAGNTDIGATLTLTLPIASS